MASVGDSGNVSSSSKRPSLIKENLDAFLKKINENLNAIKVFDKDGNGEVTMDELSEALNNDSQWGAFDEVSLNVASEDELLNNEPRKITGKTEPSCTKNRVIGSDVINRTVEDDVDIVYRDNYDLNGNLNRSEQKVHKKTIGREHQVDINTFEGSMSYREVITSDKGKYQNSYSFADYNERGNHTSEDITIEKDGQVIRFSAFEFKDSDGNVTWEGKKVYVNGEDLLANND